MGKIFVNCDARKLGIRNKNLFIPWSFGWSAITLWPLTGEVSNTDCLGTAAPARWWDTFSPQSWCVASRKMDVKEYRFKPQGPHRDMWTTGSEHLQDTVLDKLVCPTRLVPDATHLHRSCGGLHGSGPTYKQGNYTIFDRDHNVTVYMWFLMSVFSCFVLSLKQLFCGVNGCMATLKLKAWMQYQHNIW